MRESRLNARAIEAAAVDVVAGVAPWLAPLPTMWLVWERTVTHLGWPWWVGFVAGLTLELLGLAILATCLTLYNYNRDKRKSDPAANMVLPWVLVGLYFLSAELLTVLLDTAPKLAREQVTTVADWAPAVFPVLSVAGFALLALRADHKRRVDAIEQNKAEARLARSNRRAEAKAEREQNDQKSEPTDQNTESPLPFTCSLCPARFATQAALNGHGNKHRAENH